MSEITFGPGHGPLMRDGHQERFWALFAAEAEAPPEHREQAQALTEAFLRAHPERAFAVFRPEDVEATFDSDIVPLDVESLPADGLPADE